MNNVATPESENNELGPILGVMLGLLMLVMLTQLVAAETASLSGHVRDSEGDPIDGVQLSLNGLTYTTVADGYYEFAGLTPGILSLEVVNVEDLGFEPKPSMSISLAAGDNVKDVILTVPTTKANLVGVVRHYTTLDLIEGVAVTLNGHETTTNIYGLYSFHGIEPGDYALTVSKDGFNIKAIGLTLAAGDNTLDVMLVPEGTPVAEFEVSDLSIIPATVNVGDSVEISVLVTNTGDNAGTGTITCDVTPDTFTPMAVVPVQIDIEYILNMMISVMILATVMKMMTNAISE